MRFFLVIEHGRAVAALIPSPLSPDQTKLVYSLLPEHSFNNPSLAARWSMHIVASEPDWASAQARRVPMTPPKETVSLLFL